MADLWSSNTPQCFWMFQPDPPEEAWRVAIRAATTQLGLPAQAGDIETTLALVLGEGQFGPDRWRLNPTRRLYYILKPFLPRTFTYALRWHQRRSTWKSFRLGWPVEDRYVRFQFEVARQLMITLGQPSLSFRPFWPQGYRFAFVLTHDIETGEGQTFARDVADLEESLGFRSSFNFVPERYGLDIHLMQELRERGFEIGVHGLKHDGKLYNSRPKFIKRAKRINHYLNEFGAVGFRSPLMMRNPEWMQALEVEYDLSFFDTDPYEPMPGGVMSIWPFTIGNFVELPYTLPQDSTLVFILGESTPQLWLKKLNFIKQNYGMALALTHPDYLQEPRLWDIYTNFLLAVKERGDYWHALPCEVTRWWRRRAETPFGQEPPDMISGTLMLENDHITLKLPGETSINFCRKNICWIE